jgi:hypothetical protein
MEIKKMIYESVSGGTFTTFTSENKRLKPKKTNIPKDMGEFIILLEKRIGEPVEQIIFQLDQSEHLSEERVIVNFKIDPETHMDSKTILTVSNMNTYEKIRYDQVKSSLGI